jgi:dTDP-4-amino-4,6-dideoxygalactose transaminase
MRILLRFCLDLLNFRDIVEKVERMRLTYHMVENRNQYDVPIFQPKLPTADKIHPYLKMIDSSGWYSNFGPLSRSLESRLAERIGLNPENVVTLVNATLALEGAISTADRNGDWSCPSWTFAASAHAIMGAGKRIEFLDVDIDWRMDPSRSNIDSRNFLDVLPFGDEIDLNRFSSLPNNLLIDAAGSFDSIQKLELPGNFPIGIVLSFHPTKALAGGEGALFISNDTEWVKRLRNWANFGFDGNRTAQIEGTNAKMSEYACAVTLASLDEWEAVRSEWMSLASWALELSKNVNLKVHPAMSKGFVSPYWIVQDDSERIQELIRLLEARSIQSRAWWGNGCHKMPAFSNFPRGDLSKTELLANTTVGLPFYRSISEFQKLEIEKALKAL